MERQNTPELNKKKQVTRRDFLKAGGAVTLAVFLNNVVACTTKTTSTIATTATETSTIPEKTATTTTIETSTLSEKTTTSNITSNSTSGPAPTIKFGLLNTMSGPFSSIAPYFNNASQMAVDDINGAGGLLGRQVELIIKDDQLNPGMVGQRLDELKAAGCVAFTGPLMEMTAGVAHQWANDNKVLYIDPTTITFEGRTTKFSKYIFYTAPPSYVLGKILAQNVAKQNVNSIYTIAADMTEYHDIYDHLWLELNKIKTSVTDKGATWISPIETNFVNTIPAVLAKKPDMIMTGMGGQTWASFIQQASLSDLFSKTKVALYLGGVSPDGTTPFGDKYPTGIQTTGWCPFYIDDTKMKAFSKAYLAKVKIYPPDAAMSFYISTLAALTAIKSASSTDTDSLIKALETMSFETPVGNLHYRDFDHQINIPVWYLSSGYSADFPIPIGLNSIKYGDEVYPTKDEILALRSAK